MQTWVVAWEIAAFKCQQPNHTKWTLYLCFFLSRIMDGHMIGKCTWCNVASDRGEANPCENVVSQSWRHNSFGGSTASGCFDLAITNKSNFYTYLQRTEIEPRKYLPWYLLYVRVFNKKILLIAVACMPFLLISARLHHMVGFFKTLQFHWKYTYLKI